MNVVDTDARRDTHRFMMPLDDAHSRDAPNDAPSRFRYISAVQLINLSINLVFPEVLIAFILNLVKDDIFFFFSTIPRRGERDRVDFSI